VRRLNVLVAEDDAVIAMAVGSILTGMGHHVCTIASTEAEAVEIAAAEHPGLLIVDAHLADGDGRSVVRRITSAHGALPHVFISGDGPGETPLGPHAAWLQKPFAEQDLERAVSRVVGAMLS
jgi:CheY-like chemotaxis protein